MALQGTRLVGLLLLAREGTESGEQPDDQPDDPAGGEARPAPATPTVVLLRARERRLAWRVGAVMARSSPGRTTSTGQRRRPVTVNGSGVPPADRTSNWLLTTSSRFAATAVVVG